MNPFYSTFLQRRTVPESLRFFPVGPVPMLGWFTLLESYLQSSNSFFSHLRLLKDSDNKASLSGPTLSNNLNLSWGNLHHIKSVSIARLQGLLYSFCASSSGNFFLVRLHIGLGNFRKNFLANLATELLTHSVLFLPLVQGWSNRRAPPVARGRQGPRSRNLGPHFRQTS